MKWYSRMLLLVSSALTCIITTFVSVWMVMFWLETDMEKALGVGIVMLAIGLMYARLFAIMLRNIKTAKGEKQ